MSTFKIYNASAGSGKTYQIAYLFEKRLLSDPSPFAFQEIMAITFTNKAVYEMKERIIDDLRSFTRNDPDEKATEKRAKLADDLGFSIEEVQNRSRRILSNILDNYAGYQVTTIDSLTHRIVRTFARDLHFDANFDIELEVEDIFEEAVEAVIEEVKADDTIKDIISEYIEYQSEEGKSWNIKGKLIDLAKLLIDENHDIALQEMSSFSTSDILALKKELKQKNETIKLKIQDKADEFFKLLERNELSPENFTGKYLPNFIDKKRKGELELTSIPAYISQIEEKDLYNSKEKPEVIARMEAIKPDYVPIVREILQLNLDILFYDKILAQLSQVALLQVIYDHTERIKEARNCLFINDFNKRINEEIRKQPAPFIYERLGEKFNDFFIDEFQDTSHLQWKNLIPLIENALSRSKDGNPGSLTLVGDVKQSIYAWRGGDPDIFLRMIKGQSPFPISGENIPLKNNYRSNKDIVEFNNELFTYLSKSQPYQKVHDIYAQVAQCPKKQESAYIEIDMGHDKDERPYPEMVLEKINFISEKEKDEQQFKRSDICVLVRSNKESQAIAELLEESNISVITATDLLVHKDSSVQLIHHFLRCLFMDGKDEDQLTVLENYMEMKHNESIGLDSFRQMLRSNIEDFVSRFNRFFNTAIEPQRMYRYSLMQQVEYLVQELGLEDGANIYLNAFLEEVHTYNNKENADARGFLSYWESHKDDRSVSTSTLEDSVNLMTIHKSKGLEFPYIIIPGLDDSLDDITKKKYWQEIPDTESEIPFSLISQPGKMLMENDRSKENITNLKKDSVLENLNLLYVSCTRASKGLFLLSEKPKRSKKGSLKMNGLLLDFVEEKGFALSEEDVFYTGEWPDKTTKSEEESITSPFPVKLRSNIEQLEKRMVLNANLDDQELKKGKLLHELMGFVHIKNDLPKAIDRLEKKMRIPGSLKNELRSVMESIIKHDDLKDYFTDNWTVHNEKDISYAQEIIRPDRICIKKDEAVIIDYKTGVQREEHQQQIKKYASAVEDMGYRTIGRFLIYVNEGIAVKNV